MKPVWFPINEIPYNEMWADVQIWMKHLLDRQYFMNNITFTGYDKIISSDLKLLTLE